MPGPILTLILATVALCSVAAECTAQAEQDGKTLYSIRCAACHDTGLLGAPRVDSPDMWNERMQRGRGVLLDHAIKGFNQMPPRGGNPTLTDAQVAAALDYMLSRVAPGEQRPPAAETRAADTAAEASPPPRPTARPVAQTRGVNSFNRLMKPPSKRNLPPTQDGIHDPDSEGTRTLQAPRDAFAGLPKSTSGNRVDWVQSLDKGAIAPRFDRQDPNAAPVIMDLNIVREVKGSMPDVVYPHKQHTEWLDCSNCHPAIFVPQKGANAMSMAGILLGKQCGVCHGKVAFPVSECRRCHSAKKSGGN
ncbi:MAG: c-type cytochrome [Gammaproteobacteria bacterium]|nr:c-type cytochrome [Gammaproteobacteria bacterium]